MDETSHKKIESAPEIETPMEIQKEKPEFRSSFKVWIRVVAFVVVSVFLPEQVAQAVEYDWRVIWNKPAAAASSPAYLQATP
mgnify:CR=1 FL=1